MTARVQWIMYGMFSILLTNHKSFIFLFVKKLDFHNTVVTFVNLIFFLCKSMQICCLVISANRTSACKSPFANLFSPCKSLFGNHCVACKSVAFSDENRCNSNSKRIFFPIQMLLQKTFWTVALRNTAARWFTWQSF